jgi:hypothetical protein
VVWLVEVLAAKLEVARCAKESAGVIWSLRFFTFDWRKHVALIALE